MRFWCGGKRSILESVQEPLVTTQHHTHELDCVLYAAQHLVDGHGRLVYDNATTKHYTRGGCVSINLSNDTFAPEVVLPRELLRVALLHYGRLSLDVRRRRVSLHQHHVRLSRTARALLDVRMHWLGCVCDEEDTMQFVLQLFH